MRGFKYGPSREGGVLAVLTLTALLTAGCERNVFPAPAEVRASLPPSDVLVVDRSGVLLQELRTDPRVRRLGWTRLKDISPVLIEAVITSEDHRFYQHPGVDPLAVGRVLLDGLLGQRLRGASTISMQVASILNQPQRQGRRRSLREKYHQVVAALQLERQWSKDHILEAYLNLVYFRGELQGIAAASRGLFQKDPHGLDRSESLLLAALIRQPAAPSTLVAKRACILGKRLRPAFHCEELTTLATSALDDYHVTQRADLAPHIARELLADKGPAHAPAVIKTTLDADLQAYALERVQATLAEIGDRNVKEAAVIVLDNHTGNVLAYVGNQGPGSEAFYVDGVRAKRQAGSTLKPLLYGLAIEKRLITATTLLEDLPVEIPVSRGIYRPQNYDQTFHGLVTARQALASSLNIPAVRVLQMVGVASFLDILTDFGIAIPFEADFYGPSLALGAVEVSLWEMAGAYRALATGGDWSTPRLTPSANPPEQSPDEGHKTRVRRVMSPAVAFIISQILSDRGSRSLSFGLENHLATRFWTAVKTGTSKDMRDNWCVGFSEHYTVAVWVGNFSGEPMRNVTGISGAGPLWRSVISYLHREQSSTSPTPPQGIERVVVANEQSGMTYPEWFLTGTAPKTVRAARREDIPRISYPTEGLIVTFDPDIPAAFQRILLESSSRQSDMRWRLDDEDLESPLLSLESLEPGSHRIELRDAATKLWDSVTIHVRRASAGG